jgi:hypothetical protein
MDERDRTAVSGKRQRESMYMRLRGTGVAAS